VFLPLQIENKWRMRVENSEKHSSGAKAHFDFAVFAARLKSCPDTNQRIPAAHSALVFTKLPERRGVFSTQDSQANTQ
jgi:hypothetical protein